MINWSDLNPLQRIFFSFADSMVDVGYSANDVLKIAKVLDIGIRRIDALALIRSIKGAISNRDYISGINNNQIPNPKYLQTAMYPLSRKYSYLVRMRGKSEESGETIKQYFSIVSDDLISKQDAMKTAYGYMDLGYSGQTIVNPDMDVLNIRVSPSERAY